MAYAYIYSQNNISVRDEVSYGTVPGSPLTVTGTTNSGNYENDTGFVNGLTATPDGSKLFGVFQADKGLFGYNTSDWSRIDVSAFDEDDKLFANDMVRRFISSVESVDVSPDGSKLAIVINSDTYNGIVIYSVDPVAKVTEYEVGNSIQAICWSPDSDAMFIGTSNEKITRWTLSTDATVQNQTDVAFNHEYLAVVKSGTAVLSGQRFSSVDFSAPAGTYPDHFDAATLSSIGEAVSGKDPSSGTSVAPWNRLFANEDAGLVEYDADTFSVAQTYNSGSGSPYEVVVSQDQTVLVAVRSTGPSANNVSVYSVGNPTALQVFNDPQARSPAITHGAAAPPEPPSPNAFWAAFNGTNEIIE